MKTRVSSDDGRHEVVLPTSVFTAIIKRAEELQDEAEDDAMRMACVEMMGLVAQLMTVLEASY